MATRRRTGTPEPEEVSATPNRGQAPAHGPSGRSDRGPKMLVGKLLGDPDMRFTAGGKSVATIRLDDGKGQRWNATLWEGKAEEAVEKLRQGDEIKGIGRLQAEREFELPQGGTGKASHDVTLNHIGVFVGDGSIVPLEQFEREMLELPKPELSVVQDVGLADGGLGVGG